MTEDKKQNKLLTALGLGCGIPLGVLVLLFFGTLVFFSFGPEGGVRLSNTMEDYAIEYLDQNQVLLPDEKIVAYYDVTVALNGSEAAILTDSRVIYHKHGRNTTINLSDIAEINQAGNGMGGVLIQISDQAGDMMAIDIAAFNQGELFLEALENKSGVAATL
jgi:hypothetical protein